MSLIVDGTTIKNVIYNGVTLDNVICDGVEVFKLIKNIDLRGKSFVTSTSGYASIRHAYSNSTAVSLGVNSTAASVEGTGFYTTADFYDLTDFKTFRMIGEGLVRSKKYATVQLVSESGTSKQIYAKQDNGYGFTFNESINISAYTGKYKIRIGVGALEGFKTPYITFTTMSLLQ